MTLFWLLVMLTQDSHAFLCVCVCVCVLLVFFFQMTKSVTNPEELGGLASQMTSDYGQLALQGQMAAATAEPEEVCHLKAPMCRSTHTLMPTFLTLLGKVLATLGFWGTPAL